MSFRLLNNNDRLVKAILRGAAGDVLFRDCVEDEIQTLRQVLLSKFRRQQYLKRQLGITPIAELKSEVKQGLDTLRTSDACVSLAKILESKPMGPGFSRLTVTNCSTIIGILVPLTMEHNSCITRTYSPCLHRRSFAYGIEWLEFECLIR
ncbi:unnamed protein product [Trichobilharzia regenti]|nr:unnamed protein product [Trichobilharzia regenti]